jgi:hypothetical protein
MFSGDDKGELERDVAAMGFPKLSIFRPGFLVGRPKGRWAEEIAGTLMPLLDKIAPNKVSFEIALII